MNTMPSEVLRHAQGFLASVRNANGSWPYMAGKPAAAEPTCYAALAFGEESAGRSCEWLRSRVANKAGSALQWEKSLGLFALQKLGAPADVCDRIARRLVDVEVRATASNRDINDLDAKLRGWSWVEGTFSWVEPTSYALLALKASALRAHPRVAEGERLLLDRVCFDGGWNYGNRKVRGEALDSMMPTTALAAMALQQVPGAEAAVGRALDLLDREAKVHPSSLSLALTILCFGVFNRPASHLRDALTARQKTDGSWRQQTHLTALALLALEAAGGGRNVFRI